MSAPTFVIDQKELFTIMGAMQPMCSRRTTLDATSFILFQIGHKEVTLKATDLEVSLQASVIMDEGTVTSPISFLVPGKKAFDLIKELEGPISFCASDTRLTFKAGGIDLSLNIRQGDNFPPFPERIENIMQLEASFLLEMINKVAFLVPQSNANPAVNGLFIEISPTDFRMTATDGHCLVQARSMKYTLEERCEWLIPRRAIMELKKLVEACIGESVFIGTSDKQLVFSSHTFNFFTRTLAYAFPQYEAILNRTGFIPARLDRTHFVKALRRSSCLLSGKFIATNFYFEDKKVRVSMQNDEIGSLNEEVPVGYFNGEPVHALFYAPYLLGGLQFFPSKEVDFYLKSSAKPILFESSADDMTISYLVMPVAPTNGQRAG